MNPALTVKSHVNLPQEIRPFLGMGPGECVKFEPMADSRVAMTPAEPRKSKAADPFERMKGSDKSAVRTEKAMRATRGEVVARQVGQQQACVHCACRRAWLSAALASRWTVYRHAG